MWEQRWRLYNAVGFPCTSETLGSEHAFNTAASKGPAPLGCHLRVTAYAATPRHASRTLPRANQFLGCRADDPQVGQALNTAVVDMFNSAFTIRICTIEQGNNVLVNNMYTWSSVLESCRCTAQQQALRPTLSMPSQLAYKANAICLH